MAPIVVGSGLLAATLAGCAAPSSMVESSPPPSPPAFPRIEGAVLSTAEPVAGDWTTQVSVSDDAPTAYRAARRLLVEGGYDLTNDEPFVDGGSGQACTSALCVTFSSLATPSGGATVDYEVFPNTGVAG
jgi:hypothetical protein